MDPDAAEVGAEGEGLVGQLRTSANITRLLGYSVALYDRLAEETGQATGFRAIGHCHLATSRERLEGLRREAAFARIRQALEAQRTSRDA